MKHGSALAGGFSPWGGAIVVAWGIGLGACGDPATNGPTGTGTSSGASTGGQGGGGSGSTTTNSSAATGSTVATGSNASTGSTVAGATVGAGGSGVVDPPDGGSTGTGGGGGAGGTGPGAPDGGGTADASDRDGALGAEGGVVVTDPGTEGDGNFMIASPFRNAPEYTVAAGVKRGRTIRFTMNGMNSTIYKGTYMRNAAVYLPADYVSGTEIPFMVAQDGLQYGYLNNIVPILDNYIASGKLPAMAVIAADPSNQRSVEYDTVSDTFVRFVESELLPEAKSQVKTQANLDLNLTNDPEGRSSYGGSSGGSCAFVMGWFGNYRRILTVSGSFRPLQRSTMYPMGAAEFQSSLVPNNPAKPLRVFLEAGSSDLGGWKDANDALAAALAAKKYHYRYVFAQGAGHTDGAAMHQYLPETMLWLWRGYPIKR